MGVAGSRLEKALGDQFPEGERYFGLENYGNTCYCNSVLQVRFYFCFDKSVLVICDFSVSAGCFRALDLELHASELWV